MAVYYQLLFSLVLLVLCRTYALGESVGFQDSPSNSLGISTQSNLRVSTPCNLPSVLIHERIVFPIDESCNIFHILRCYCLTLDEGASRQKSSSTPHLLIGRCIYGCFKTERTSEYRYVSLSSDNGTCSEVNRRGPLCGECVEGYGVPAYSFSLKCVHCGNESLWTTILLYVLVAYGPLTVFLAVIVVFTVSVNSAPLRGWILVCQILSNNFGMYIIIINNEFHSNTHLSPYLQIMASIYGIWNLDFFRSVYKPFCLHPSLTTLQVMALDYIIGAYPLVLIVVMYAMVELYSRNCRPVVLFGRMLHHCCVRFRHELNIRTSLVDAFGTFFSLSFVKFLSTTMNLLASTAVWSNKNSTKSMYVYFEGGMPSFKDSHIPFAVVALFVSILCNILPLILILLYSFPRGQVVINFLPGPVQRAIYPFVDNILACYKDGTDGTRNCRYFAVVYYFALFGSIGCIVAAKSPVMYGFIAYVCIVAGMLVAVIQPYKSKVYNTVDIVLTLSVGLCHTSIVSYFISFLEAPFERPICFTMLIASALVPLCYIIGFVGLKCYFKVRKMFNHFLRARQVAENEGCEQPLLFNFPQSETL